MKKSVPEIVALIKEVLEKSYLMSLATVDDGGVWVSDVIYVFDDNLNIYWMSDPGVRHSQAILKNPHVSGTITTSGPKEKNLGIQFNGIGTKIEGPRWDLAKLHYAKRDKEAPAEGEDVLHGDSWYMIKPKFIQLTNEKLFGFDKQSLEF